MAIQRWQAQNEGLSKRAIEILHLLAEGLSDREIAERLVMTINTVKWYNRQIYSILGVSSRTQAIARAHELGLLDTDTDSATYSQEVYRPPRHNLPAETTHFIGRRYDRDAIKRLLDSTHLLTLVGPPGTGKTRLALQVGRELVDRFREGVYFVSLAPISDTALVMNAIANAAQVTEVHGQPMLETLKHCLRECEMLLILDNFEHLLPAATQVSQLLAAAPNVKVLATSREPLHLYGEQEYAVAPLELPDPERLDPLSLSECESVALFMQQARAVRPDFQLTLENALDVAQICVRLEGLPLAIELAAARTRLLPPRTLLARLMSRLDTLTGGAHDLPQRQRTLRSTVEWSYNLLDEGEKILFARLAVFQGGCSLEAVEAVCGHDLPVDVFDGLDSLVNKSLIQQKEVPGGNSRFVILETLHEYAWERLNDLGETETMRRRHAEYFVELAERGEPHFRLAQQYYWFRLLENEHDNLRAVLHWSLDDGDRTLGIRLGGALCLFWFACGHHAEAQNWTVELLDKLDSVITPYHTKLLFTAGHVFLHYDLGLARQYFDQALMIARELGDEVDIAWALIFGGYTMLREKEAALARTEEGLALFRQMNHKPGVAQALNIIGEIALYNGDDARAKPAYEECLQIAQETGEQRRIRFVYGNLTFLAQHEGDTARAREWANKALRLALEMNSKMDICNSVAGLAGVLAMDGEPALAASLLGAWEALLDQMGAAPQLVDLPEHEKNIEAVRAQLSPEAFETAWAKGRAMSLEQAVALCMELSEA